MKDVSDQGNQHNHGPHQDQILDNPSVLCLAPWALNWLSTSGFIWFFYYYYFVYFFGGVGVGGGGGGGQGKTNAPSSLFMKGVGHSLSLFFFLPSDLLCLRFSRSEYNASAMSYLHIFPLFLRFDLKMSNTPCMKSIQQKAK